MAGVPKIWTRQTVDERRFEFHFTLTFEDVYAWRRLRSKGLTLRLYVILLAALGLLPTLAYSNTLWRSERYLSSIGVVLALVPLAWLVGWLTHRIVRHQIAGFFYGFYKSRNMIDREIDFVMDAEGYSIDGESHTVTVRWKDLFSLEQDAERYFFLCEPLYGHVLPRREIPEDQRTAVHDALNDWCPGMFDRIRSVSDIKTPLI